MRLRSSPRWIGCVALALLPLPVRCQHTGTQTQTLTINFGPAAVLSVPGTATLTSSGPFQPFNGSITVNYRARTSSAGSASLTLSATSDFSPAGGPSVSSNQLTYTCGSASLGSSCTGAQTISTSSQPPVVTMGGLACTGGGGSCSASDPNTVNLNLTVPDLMTYKAGAYTAALTFTISAL